MPRADCHKWWSSQNYDTSDEWSQVEQVSNSDIYLGLSQPVVLLKAAGAMLKCNLTVCWSADFTHYYTDHPGLMIRQLQLGCRPILAAKAFVDLTAACSGFIFALSTAEKSTSLVANKEVWSSVAKRFRKSLIGRIVRRQSDLVMGLGSL